MKKNPYNVSLNPTAPPKLPSRAGVGYGERGGVDLNQAAKPKRRRRKK